MTASRYLVICLGSALVFLAGIASFNFAIDPFGVYHDRKPWDPIHHRDGIPHFLYGHKAFAVREFKPDVIILGNSRVFYGMDPNHPALPPKTYNLGLPGSGIYVNWRYLQQACAGHLPQMVIMGIDSTSFGVGGEPPSDFLEARLRVTPQGHFNPLSPFADMEPTLFSTKALYYSYRTVMDLRDRDFIYPQGFAGDDMLKAEHMDLTQNVYAANRGWLKPRVFNFREPNGAAPPMEAFGKIVSFCAQNHIHLVVYTHPMHASMIDRDTADWNKYGDWFKTVLATMESVPGAQNELWDFVGYNEMTTENFPAPSETYSHMRYFWECSHYKPNVGAMVLSRILTASAPVNFGQRVSSANFQEDLDRIKSEKEAWHQHGQFVQVNQVAPSGQ